MKYLLVLVFILTIQIAYSQHDFRKASWGMTTDEVKAFETNIIFVTNVDEYIYFVINDLIGPIKVICTYKFNSDSRLIEGGYSVFKPNDIAWDLITTNLFNKYGKPTASQLFTDHNKYSNKVNTWSNKTTIIEESYERSIDMFTIRFISIISNFIIKIEPREDIKKKL